jgi:hypothetical protein
MKKTFTLIIVLCIGLSAFAQFDAIMKRHAIGSPALNRMASINVDLPVVGEQVPNSIVSNKSVLTDPVTAVTIYDEQSNAAMQNRCYLYADGTMGATCTWSDQQTSWTDRGTGYNYFDGTNWGSQPSARIETVRTGWPDYRPFGATGEIVIAHEASGPLVINTRTVKGTGAWTQTIMPALPSGMAGIFWPRMVTNGTNHTNIHVIAVTEPTANGGTVYNGMNGALVYCHSLDGGVTWSSWIQPTGLTSTNYLGFSGDNYSFAEPHGDTLAFTIGDSFCDQILEKSTDNGTTWTITILYQSPYDLGGSSPHRFYCPDGASAIALDKEGYAHIVFGLQYDSGTADASTKQVSYSYNLMASGIVYWNEHMSQLDPSLNPDTLNRHHQYAGWIKDTNFFYLTTTELVFWNGISCTSHPDLVIDNTNKIFLSYDAGTSLLDPNNYSMRHLLGRNGLLKGDTVMWYNDTLVDITGDWIQYNFSECVFPSASPTTDYNYIYILFQVDDYGGTYVLSVGQSGWQGQTAPDNNSMTMIKWAYPPNFDGTNVLHEKPTFSVGQNFPNPVNGLTKVNAYLQNAGDLSLNVTNLEGQTLMTMENSNAHAGVSQFVIDGSQLTPGVYFYTVREGNQSITKKMVIE